jgi:beta-glucosidase
LAFTIHGTTRRVEPGEFELMIGRSSEDIAFKETIEVLGEPRELPAKWKMRTEARVDPTAPR